MLSNRGSWVTTVWKRGTHSSFWRVRSSCSEDWTKPRASLNCPPELTIAIFVWWIQMFGEEDLLGLLWYCCGGFAEDWCILYGIENSMKICGGVHSTVLTNTRGGHSLWNEERTRYISILTTVCFFNSVFFYLNTTVSIFIYCTGCCYHERNRRTALYFEEYHYRYDPFVWELLTRPKAICFIFQPYFWAYAYHTQSIIGFNFWSTTVSFMCK